VPMAPERTGLLKMEEPSTTGQQMDDGFALLGFTNGPARGPSGKYRRRAGGCALFSPHGGLRELAGTKASVADNGRRTSIISSFGNHWMDAWRYGRLGKSTRFHFAERKLPSCTLPA